MWCRFPHYRPELSVPASLPCRRPRCLGSVPVRSSCGSSIRRQNRLQAAACASEGLCIRSRHRIVTHIFFLLPASIVVLPTISHQRTIAATSVSPSPTFETEADTIANDDYHPVTSIKRRWAARPLEYHNRSTLAHPLGVAAVNAHTSCSCTYCTP